MPTNKIFRCRICGNIVSLLHAGAGVLTCCGEEMILVAENSTDAVQEKHVPVIEKTETGYKIKIGEVPHPMEEKHFIEWIELLVGNKAYRQFLKPGDAPVAFFEGVHGDTVAAREYCNLHGLWKG